MPPASAPPTFMNRRRVTVSPSNAPGYWRSRVYLDLCLSCLADTQPEQYRGGIQGGVGTPAMLVRIASIASGARAHARRLAWAWASLEPHPTACAPASHTA